jgi:hypothetical protein
MTRDKVYNIVRLIRNATLNECYLSVSAYSIQVVTSNIARYKYKRDKYRTKNPSTYICYNLSGYLTCTPDFISLHI